MTLGAIKQSVDRSLSNKDREWLHCGHAVRIMFSPPPPPWLSVGQPSEPWALEVVHSLPCDLKLCITTVQN